MFNMLTFIIKLSNVLIDKLCLVNMSAQFVVINRNKLLNVHNVHISARFMVVDLFC